MLVPSGKAGRSILGFAANKRKRSEAFCFNIWTRYGVLVNILWREGKIDEAVLAVQDMERQGIVGSAALYYDLARCLCSAGRCQEALMQEAKKLFQQMSEDSSHYSQETDNRGLVVPDIYTFNTMLDACIVEKRWDELEHVFKKMLQHGFHFNAKRHVRKKLDASRAGRVELLETTWKHLAQVNRVPPSPLIKERF